MKTLTISTRKALQINGYAIMITLFLILLVGSVTANILINGVPNY